MQSEKARLARPGNGATSQKPPAAAAAAAAVVNLIAQTDGFQINGHVSFIVYGKEESFYF